MTNSSGWIGVDLDGTIAHYDGWKGETHIGAPITPMVSRVKAWLQQGVEVRIFTARIADATLNDDGTPHHADHVVQAIRSWCVQHIGVALEVTNKKDFHMVELWDDRAVQVVPNIGVRSDTHVRNEVLAYVHKRLLALAQRIAPQRKRPCDCKHCDCFNVNTAEAQAYSNMLLAEAGHYE